MNVQRSGNNTFPRNPYRDVALNYIGQKSIGYVMLHYIQYSCPRIFGLLKGGQIYSEK